MSWLIDRTSKWANKLLPTRVHDDPDYQKAHEFKDTYSPKEGVDYDWIQDYARLTYDRFQQADELLDAKAESIIKILGGGTGLVTLGAILNLSKLGLPAAIGLGISLLLALVAIAVAAWVRVPRQTFLPPSVAWALTYADFYREAAPNKFLAQWHLACEGARLAVRAKARGVKVATWFAFAALVCLTLSFFIAVCTIDDDGSGQLSGGSRMSSDTQHNTPPAPDPSGSPQTPDPAISAEPQVFEKGVGSGEWDPAAQAEPQSLQFSHDGASGKR